MKKAYLIYFTLLFNTLLVGCSSSSTQKNQGVTEQKAEEVVVVEQPKEIIKKEAKDLKILNQSNRKIIYKNNGERKTEECDVCYKILKEESSKRENRFDRITRITQHIIIEEFNQPFLSEDIMKEIAFNAYNEAKGLKGRPINSNYSLVFYPNKQIADNQEKDNYLAILNDFQKGVKIKYDYDKMNAFSEKNNPSAKFFDTDGSHKGLKAHILKTMHAPKTFEHIKTTYTDNGNYLLVTMKFRATNKKAENKEFIVVAQCDLDGNVTTLNEVK